MPEHPHFVFPNGLQRIMQNPLDREAMIRGNEAETRVAIVLPKYLSNLVESVPASSARENFIGIDRWIFFLQSTGHKNRPAQIKSTKSNIYKFKKSSRYSELLLDYGPFYFFHAGPKTTDDQIVESFLAQVVNLDGFV